MEIQMKNFGKYNSYVWRAKEDGNHDGFTLTVSGIYRPDAFLNIVGSLTWNNFDIIDAKSFHQQNMFLNVFKIKPIFKTISPPELLKSAEEDFEMIWKRDFQLIEKIRLKAVQNSRKNRGLSPTYVTIRNNCLDYTVVTVSTKNDFPGILFLISDTLVNCHVDICSAQIQTVNGHVEDQFYLRNLNGRLLSHRQQMEVKSALKHVLP